MELSLLSKGELIMKKRFRKSLIAIFSCLAVSCTGLASVGLTKASATTFTANASDIITVSDGLTATYNVSGSEKVSALTKDTRKGIHFSATENGNAAEGNSVVFNNTLSGLFEMDFRVYTQNKGKINYGGGDWFNGNDAEEIREVAITLTDTDKNESFTLYIKGGSPWLESVPNARVAYGDVGANYGTGIRYGYSGNGQDYDDTTTPYNGGTLSSKEYNTQLKGTSFTNWYLHSTVVGFDPITKEVYQYNFKSSADETQYASILNRRVILDLDDTDHLAYAGTGASELLNCDFNNYTVKFTLTDVTGASETGSQGKDEPANFIIYSLNGQSLGGENGTLTSSAAPGLSVKFTETAKQYQEYTLPTPTLKGVLGETATFDGKVKVLNPNGGVVIAERAFAEGIKFTPESFGEYTVVYSGVKDANGNVRKAFTASGEYAGAEIVYAYSLTVEKTYDVTASASEFITASGLNVTYNVSGSEQHADLIRDTNKGIMFTSQNVGANAVGASVAFKNSLTGTMELNFRVFSESTDSSSDWWNGGAWHTRNNAEELREIAITVTDDITQESFTVYVAGGTSWNAITPNARVAYGDVGANFGSGRWYKSNSNGLEYYGATKGLTSAEYNTELVGTSFTNRARNASGFIGSGYSTNIGFDPVTKTVYAYAYGTGAWECAKRPILDLDDPEDMQYLTMTSAGNNVNADLPETFVNSTFENYTVKMTVTEMTDEKTAKFIVYNLNGQSLRGKDGELMSDAGYGMYLPESEDRFVGLEDNFPVPYASSVLTGKKAFTGTIEIVDENGNVVLQKQAYSENVKFTPSTAGSYVAYYGGMTDENDCVRLAYNLGNYDGEEERFAYTFEVKEQALELSSYEYVMKLMNVEIGAKSLSSALTTYLTIKKDGVIYEGVDGLEIQNNYSYAFKHTGNYDLIYTVKNSVGGEVSYSTSVEVIAMTGSVKTADTVVMLGNDCIWDYEDFTVYYCNEGAISDFEIYAEVYNGESWIAVASAPSDTVNLKDVLLSLGEGEWNVRFEITKNGDSIWLEKSLQAKDSFAPVINADSLGNGFIPVPEEDSESVKNFVVLEGTVCVIPNATAMDAVDGEVTVNVSIKTPSDTSAKDVVAGTEITFTAGEYVIVYRAVDKAGNETSFFYFITAKTLWLDITATANTVELGSAVVISAPEATNGFTGEKVTDFNWTAVVTLNGEVLEEVGGEYVPVYTGAHEIVYTLTYAGISQDYTISVMVEDTQKPTVMIDGTYQTQAELGDTITVFDAQVEDESSYNLTVVVIYNDVNRVELNENNEFVTDKAGKYLIRYSVTDMAGNTATVEYTITVKDPNAKFGFGDILAGCSSSVGSMVAMTAVMAVAGYVTLKKKEN